MSAALLPAPRDPPAISPHLLHSPQHSPILDIHHIMHDYRPVSPHPLYYPPSPAPDPAPPPVPAPITSPSGMLIVHSYGPASAPPGATLTAQVDFRNLSRSNVRLRIVFGDLALPTSVSSNAREPVLGQEYGDWNLEISVPPVGQASTHMADVLPDGHLEWPLTLQALDVDGNLLDTVSFGLFVYEDHAPSPKNSPTSSPPHKHKSRFRSPNKRSRQDDNDYSPPNTTKRFAADTEEMNLRRMAIASADAPFANTQHGPTANRVFTDGPSPAPSQTLPPGMSLHPHVFQHHLQLQTATLPSHMPPEAFTVQPVPEEYTDDGPALVRTTQLASNGERLAGCKASQASVAVQGDLEALKFEWSDAERAARRRLVQFWKRQVGTTLHISFAAIPQHQYTENTIVVSCISRDNSECYITSVDVIYLLEALAGNRFEVEEKNRIRRNLEGFRPTTISKGKTGTEGFFKIIMEFATPKPRNIEKDLKVFEWSKLKLMLEKVFSKYSTVPLSPGSSPRYDGSAPGPSGNLYAFPPKGNAIPDSNEPPLVRTTCSRSPKTRRKRSAAAAAPRLQDAQLQAPLSASDHSGHAYNAEGFSPSKFETLEYNPTIEPGEYSFGGMRFLGMPSELDSGIFKVDMPPSGGNENVTGSGPMHIATPGTVRPLDAFRSPSPPSSDNSPISSMSLSLSSGTSSGQAESQDVAGLPTSDPEHPNLPQHL